MTVELTFEPDDEAMRESAEELAANQSWDRFMGLGITWPWLPTRLVVGGVTVFDLPEVSVLALAYDLPIYLALAWEQGSADCAVFEYENLLIRRTAENLCLKLRGDPEVGCAPLPELLAAANQFAQKVRHYTLKWLPQLADDPDWGEWLRGGPDPPDIHDRSSA